jgi:hypothetical protein
MLHYGGLLRVGENTLARYCYNEGESKVVDAGILEILYR